MTMTKKITDITSFRAVQNEFWSDIDAILSQYGGRRDKASVSFVTGQAVIKMNVSFGGEEQIRQNYETFAPSYGLNVPFGAKFKWSGSKVMKVVGLTVGGRSEKRVQLEGENGKGYICTPDQANKMYQVWPVGAPEKTEAA